jgi:hypothetical protein
LAGCFTASQERPTGLVERLKPFAGLNGADTVTLVIAPLELPVGDRYLNDGLWATADEHILDLDRKAVLEDNGFRIGMLGGIPPAEYLNLLTSPRTNPNARRSFTRAGTAKTVLLGEAHPLLHVQVRADGQSTPAEFTQAQCVLQITPTLATDGGVKLAFQPVVQHGSKVLWALAADGQMPLQGQQSIQRYPALEWEVTLNGPEYVIIGTRFDQVETLGHGFFVHADAAKPVQRLLAICASRVTPEASAEGSDATRRSPAVPPLALQAMTTIRGTAD